MKILFIVPGSGDSFYCGNCFRDTSDGNAQFSRGDRDASLSTFETPLVPSGYSFVFPCHDILYGTKILW